MQQDFYIVFDHFGTLCIKELKHVKTNFSKSEQNSSRLQQSKQKGSFLSNKLSLRFTSRFSSGSTFFQVTLHRLKKHYESVSKRSSLNFASSIQQIIIPTPSPGIISRERRLFMVSRRMKVESICLDSLNIRSEKCRRCHKKLELWELRL